MTDDTVTVTGRTVGHAYEKILGLFPDDWPYTYLAVEWESPVQSGAVRPASITIKNPRSAP